MNRASILPCVSLFLCAACASSSGGTAQSESSESVASSVSAQRENGRMDRLYALTNESGNAIVVYDAGEDGSLHERSRVSTGGAGSGDGLGSQGALALSEDGRWLFAVNAGSNELSLLRVTHAGLLLAGRVPSGGTRPVSVAESRGLVYVLNAGVPQNVTGFRFDDGALRPMPDSTRTLSSATDVGPAEVAFSPDGDALVVTEKATNQIDTFVVRFDGSLSGMRTTASTGNTPFGFAFDRDGALIVSDAFGGALGAGALSSYLLDDDAMPNLVTGPVENHQGAPCWVVVTRDGHFAYASNTASGTISGYDVTTGGAISLFGDGGATATTGDASKPADMALDDESHVLYVLNGGTGGIASFSLGNDGSLTAVAQVSGLPSGAAGLVAR